MIYSWPKKTFELNSVMEASSQLQAHIKVEGTLAKKKKKKSNF